MPRTAMTVTDITRAGVAVPSEQTVDVVNGNELPNDSRIALLVRNSGAVTRNLTVAFAYTVDGQTIAPRAYAISAGASRYIGPFDTSTYGTTLALNGDNTELKVTPLRLA
jgi:hypothetical protein